MTLYQFNDLDELEQWQTMDSHALVVGSWIDDAYKIELYQIFNFEKKKKANR